MSANPLERTGGAPAVVIVLALASSRPLVANTATNAPEQRRLIDWIANQPKMVDLLDRAMRLRDGDDWAERVRAQLDDEDGT